MSAQERIFDLQQKVKHIDQSLKRISSLTAEPGGEAWPPQLRLTNSDGEEFINVAVKVGQATKKLKAVTRPTLEKTRTATILEKTSLQVPEIRRLHEEGFLPVEVAEKANEILDHLKDDNGVHPASEPAPQKKEPRSGNLQQADPYEDDGTDEPQTLHQLAEALKKRRLPLENRLVEPAKKQQLGIAITHFFLSNILAGNLSNLSRKPLEILRLFIPEKTLADIEQDITSDEAKAKLGTFLVTAIADVVEKFWHERIIQDGKEGAIIEYCHHLKEKGVTAQGVIRDVYDHFLLSVPEEYRDAQSMAAIKSIHQFASRRLPGVDRYKF